MDDQPDDSAKPVSKRSFLRELVRRHVFPIAIAYSVGAWVFIEISSVVLPAFNAPDWVLRAFILLAVGGFPVALIISWIFDITPGGIVRTDDVDAALARQKKKSKPIPSERRQLTILHLHLSWSDADDQEEDAEEIRDALAAYKTLLQGVVDPSHGHLYYFASQQIVICFGYPKAREDDAQHAARTGLAIAEATRAFNRDAKQQDTPCVDLDMGLDTGVAVIERLGKGEAFSIVGSLADRAEWLSTFSEESQFVVSKESEKLLAGYFHLEPLGEHARVRGGPATTLFSLCGEGERRSRLDARGRFTALVGRQPEMAILEQRWVQTREGQGQVVVIAGESGLGKSRLARELRAKALRETSDTIAEFTCFADYQNSVLHPVSGFLRQQIALQYPEITPDCLADALEQLLLNAGLPLAESMPLMLDLLGLDDQERYPMMQLAPALQKRRTLETLLALLLGEDPDSASLIIVDDLQWADATFREWIEMLVDNAPSVSALIVFTTRPENLPDWITRSHVTQITLPPLTAAETTALVTAVGEQNQLPDAVVAQLVSSAQGNPLFAEELTRGALNVDLARQDEGQTASELDLEIPLTLQESLLARLDRLRVDAKTVVRLAATIGRQFDYHLAKAFAEALAVEEFDELLQQLLAEDIIYQRGVPPNASYRFRHVLIQEAAYQSILKREREAYHLQIAELLRDQFPLLYASNPEQPARHLTRAEKVDEAIPLWCEAGRLAARKAAHVEACSLFSNALELLKTQPESAQRDAAELDVQISLGPALMAIKGYSAQEVRVAYSRAEQLSNQADSTLAIAPVLFGLWTHHLTSGKLTRAMSLGQRLFSIAEASDNEDLILESHVLLGVTQSYIGPMVESLAHLDAAGQLYNQERHGSHAFVYGQDPRMASLSYAAIPQWWLGYTLKASTSVEDAIVHARKIDHPRSLAFALANGARTELKRGDYHRCIELGSEATLVSKKHGYPDFLAMGRFHQLAGEYRVEKSDDTLNQLRDTLDALLAVGNSVSVPYYCSVLADILSIEGKFEEAAAKLVIAEQRLERHGQDLDAAEVYRIRGLVDWRQQMSGTIPEGSPEAALRKAHDLAMRQGAASWRLLASLSLAEYLLEQQQPIEAGGLLTDALDAVPEQGHLPAFNDARRLLQSLPA